MTARIRPDYREQPILTTEEAALYLDCSVRHLEGCRQDPRKGGPPWFRLADSRIVKYRRDSLDEWSRGRETTAIPLRRGRAV